LQEYSRKESGYTVLVKPVEGGTMDSGRSRAIDPKAESGRLGNYNFEHSLTNKKKKVNTSELERTVSTIGGTALLISGLIGLTRKNWNGLWMGLSGAYFTYRGITGHCAFYEALHLDTSDPTTHGGILVERSIVVRRSARELYNFWRDFENLPSFMTHLESVWMTGDHRWHWVAKAPAGMSVEWDADVVVEQPGELIAWQSTADSEIPNEGSVEFISLPDNQGTEVRVSFVYYPPAGKLGAWIAKLFGEEPEVQVDDDLRHFKELMEMGEGPRTRDSSGSANRN